ncbi:MAG: D-alanyl-D-alanine carboxypeptidase DacB [Chlamydiae bacterium]|nr:D-alanyl-D-alanine carboxypeptidase DacB [Chlamydiota bacterium]
MFRLLILTILSFPLYAGSLNIEVEAEEAILLNGKTGKVLFEKNGYEPAFPASTTKMATALYALHLVDDPSSITFVADQDSIASITPQAKKQSLYRSPPHWLETDGTHMSIKLGEEIPLIDLLYGSLVGSANDASNVLAKNLGGTIPKFMEDLNQFLKTLGCENTYFLNPHGLHHPSHVSSPYDLALIAKKGLENPLFREIVSTSRYSCPQTNLEEERTIVQSNLLLRPSSPFYMESAIGVKTGNTQAAGKNLVAAIETDDRMLIGVLLGVRDTRAAVYQQMQKMFAAATQEKKMRRTLLPPGVTNLTTKVPGGRKKLKTYLPHGFVYDYYPSEETEVQASVVWNFPLLPIAQNAQVGTLRLSDPEGNLVSETPLLTSEPISPTLLTQATHYGREGGAIWFFLALAAAILLFFVWLFRTRNRPRR